MVYYQVTYKTEKGLEVTYQRDTVERAYYLYKSLIEDFKEDGNYNSSIKLEEMPDAIILRAQGDYEIQKAETEMETEVKEVKTEEYNQPKDWFELVWGILRDEYNECLDNWSRLTGEQVEHV